MRLEDPSPARLETRVSPIVIRGGTSGAGLRARSSFFVPRPACRAFARLRATATTAGTWIQSARVVHTVPAVSTSPGTEGGAGARAAASSDAGAPAASAPLPGTKRQRRRQGPLLLRPGAQGQLSGCRFRFPWPIRPSRPLCSAKGTCSRR